MRHVSSSVSPSIDHTTTHAALQEEMQKEMQQAKSTTHSCWVPTEFEPSSQPVDLPLVSGSPAGGIKADKRSVGSPRNGSPEWSPDMFAAHAGMLKQLVAQNESLSEQVRCLTNVVQNLVDTHHDERQAREIDLDRQPRM